MPKHTRQPSGQQSRYAPNIPLSLASSSSMYNNQQQRMSIPSSYFNLSAATPTATSSMSLAPQPQQTHQHQHQHQHQPLSSFDHYQSTAAPPVSAPPLQHRPSSGAWTPQDDQQLLTARMQGLNWGQIKETYFSTKTPNACRKRHERLMERKGADDWDNRKMQRLAKEYMAMRREIWSGLAERTGEKWNVVEQKCMSNGLKNLQSAARAASRRDRLESGAPLTGYDDDSGISGIGLTPVDELDASYSSPETTASSGPHSASSSTVGYSSYPHQQQQQHHHHHHSNVHGSQHHPNIQSHAHAHLQPLGGHAAGSYGVSGYPSNGYAGHHGYSSSVSSSASAYATGNSQSSSPYLHNHRQSSADMGIGSIINRSTANGL